MAYDSGAMTDFDPERKIIDRPTAALVSKSLRESGRTLVFTNGCFDILHPGHIGLLFKARSLGDALMIGLNTDASVRRVKGMSRPVMDERSRAIMLAALEAVDWVVLFDEDTPKEIIQEVLPTVLVKGGDYKPEMVVGRETVERAGGRVAIIPLVARHSTSAILNKLEEDE